MEVVILDAGYKSYAFEKELCKKYGFRLKIHPMYKGVPSEKRDFAKNADGILVRHTTIDEVFLSEMKNLKAVVRYGVGYDNIDIEACSKYGVKVANVQGYANHSVSDHALALMFSCTRAMWNPKLQLKQKFASPPYPDIFELHGKILGIIGIGRIGSEFCKKGSPFFNQVLACDPYKPINHFNQLSAQKVELDELLEKSNVISLHCNLTNETRHLLNEEKFSIMNKKPIIINTSRGEVICEKALLHALNSGKIHSAGLDVYENEPITAKQSKLVNHPRAICTGHYAWYSDNAMSELQQRAALNMLNFLLGNTVEDCLNK
jgi:D-3-phosphoglycerate dehydrogenase / 2-oxoglutarate reductase